MLTMKWNTCLLCLLDCPFTTASTSYVLIESSTAHLVVMTVCMHMVPELKSIFTIVKLCYSTAMRSKATQNVEEDRLFSGSMTPVSIRLASPPSRDPGSLP